jgi:hypothetical protein
MCFKLEKEDFRKEAVGSSKRNVKDEIKES